MRLLPSLRSSKIGSRCRSFQTRPLQAVALAATLALMLSLVACGPGTPEERVAQTRGQYTVKLENWFPKVEDPLPIEETAPEEGAEAGEGGEAVAGAMAAEEAVAAEESEEGEGEGEEMEPVDEGPKSTKIIFDLVVLFSGSEALDGITVDVTQADGSGNEKKTWRQYLDTSGMVKSETRQIAFEAEVDLAADDAFSVQLLKFVDPANYGDYREFAEAQ